MRLVARVQHHPSRNGLLPALLAALEPLPVEVVTHSSEPPNPWEGYKLCLSDLPDCSHVLILQDDAQPVRNFVLALEQIAQRHPGTPVVLFLSGVPSATAVKARRLAKRGAVRYIPLGPSAFVPLVAVLWPREKAVQFLNWSRTARNMTRADDGNAGRWMKATHQPFLVTVPSLVEHDESQPSVKGGRQYSGGDRGRRAALLADDGLTYEW